jgi:hypothetical protein
MTIPDTKEYAYLFDSIVSVITKGKSRLKVCCQKQLF